MSKIKGIGIKETIKVEIGHEFIGGELVQCHLKKEISLKFKNLKTESTWII